MPFEADGPEHFERVVDGITHVEVLASTLTEVMEQRLRAIDYCFSGIFGGLDGLQQNVQDVKATVREAAKDCTKVTDLNYSMIRCCCWHTPQHATYCRFKREILKNIRHEKAEHAANGALKTCRPEIEKSSCNLDFTNCKSAVKSSPIDP